MISRWFWLKRYKIYLEKTQILDNKIASIDYERNSYLYRYRLALENKSVSGMLYWHSKAMNCYDRIFEVYQEIKTLVVSLNL